MGGFRVKDTCNGRRIVWRHVRRPHTTVIKQRNIKYISYSLSGRFIEIRFFFFLQHFSYDISKDRHGGICHLRLSNTQYSNIMFTPGTLAPIHGLVTKIQSPNERQRGIYYGLKMNLYVYYRVLRRLKKKK